MSHTFPGLLLGVELLFLLKWVLHENLLQYFFNFIMKPNNTGNMIAFTIVAYAFSTVLGFILDGIHHFFFEDFKETKFYEKIKCCLSKKTSDKPEEKKDSIVNPDIFKKIAGPDDMLIYQHFIEDDYWYPYEAYSNIFFAMVPGWFILPCWVYEKSKSWLYTILFFILYTVILAIIFYEAFKTYKQFLEMEKGFAKNYSSQQNKSSI